MKKMKRIDVQKICPICGNVFNIVRTIDENYKESIWKKERNYCSRNCANKRIHSVVTKKKISDKLKIVSSGYIDGRSKMTIRCKKCNTEIRGYYNKSGYCGKCVKQSNEIKEKISKSNKGKCGGLREGTSRGKSGWYKGYWCDSSWELAYVVYCLEHDIKLTRNRQGFEYQFEGELHKYYPDFILEDGSYVEIKGYMGEQNKSKIAQFPFILKVIVRSNMKEYLQYVEEKYGKNFIWLYGVIA